MVSYNYHWRDACVHARFQVPKSSRSVATVILQPQRAVASLAAVQELNPYVDVACDTRNILHMSDEDIKAFRLVVLTCSPPQECVRLLALLTAAGSPHVITLH